MTIYSSSLCCSFPANQLSSSYTGSLIGVSGEKVNEGIAITTFVSALNGAHDEGLVPMSPWRNGYTEYMTRHHSPEGFSSTR